MRGGEGCREDVAMLRLGWDGPIVLESRPLRFCSSMCLCGKCDLPDTRSFMAVLLADGRMLAVPPSWVVEHPDPADHDCLMGALWFNCPPPIESRKIHDPIPWAFACWANAAAARGTILRETP